MSGIRVTFIQNDGIEKFIGDAMLGSSLMEVGRAKDVVGILGDCGGGCSCATCHVYVSPEWQTRIGAPDKAEAETLDSVSHIRKNNSRLACQITLTPDLDGLRVVVASTD